MKKSKIFSITVRKAKLKDLDPIYRIGVLEESFAVTEDTRFYGKKYIAEMLKNPGDSILLVAEAEGEIVGFVFCSICQKTWAMWDNLAVVKEWQGKGVGTKLTKALLKELKKRDIDYVGRIVREGNEPLIKFLKKFEFKKGFKFYWVERKTKPLWPDHKKDLKKFKKFKRFKSKKYKNKE